MYLSILQLVHTWVNIFLIFFIQNIDCAFLLEPPHHRDVSKEDPQSRFWTKNVLIFFFQNLQMKKKNNLHFIAQLMFLFLFIVDARSQRMQNLFETDMHI